MEINGSQSDPNASTLNELAQINSGAEVPTSETPPTESTGEEAKLDHPAAEGQTPTEPTPGNTEAAPVTPPAVTYDGQDFASEKEAMEYMKTKMSTVETEAAIAQARQEAFEQATMQLAPSAQPAAEPTPPADDFNEEEYYADPVGYTKKREAALAERIKAEMAQTQAAAQADQQVWTEFFAAHPDLDGYRADCEMVLNANLETIKLLARKDKTQAMNLLATKTREKFQNWMERQKPQTALPNTKAGPTPGAGGAGVTPPNSETPLKDVDFCAELNNMFNS